MSEPHRWRVRTDRRVADLAALRARLTRLDEAVDGLVVVFDDDEFIDAAPDQGAFRDFTPVATLRAPHPATLEYVAELLLEEFGWIVDFVELE